MKYIQYVNEFHEWNQLEIDFINNQLVKYLQKNEENQTEIEHILDYLYNNNIDISKIWYSTIKEKAEKWNKKLQSVNINDNEEVWKDFEIIKEWDCWYKIVKLISKESYQREWKLMSHCVSSYYWNNKNIYSLRDDKNKPHATLEEDNQIKWKWNWSINPKYVKYIVEFLEELWMDIRDSEMENLWYINIQEISEELDVKKTPLFRGKYLFEWDKEKLVNKKWVKYYSLKLLDYFNLITDSLKINFDIKALVDFEISNKKKVISWYSSKNASSWNYSQNASSWDSSQNASSWDSSQNASSWNSSKNASSWDSSQNASSWYSSQNASSWNYSSIEMNGIKNVWAWIGINNKIKWINGNWICLAQYDENNEIEYMKCGEIGKKYNWELLKENTWYKLENKKFTEV